jgi:hypothetical protein
MPLNMWYVFHATVLEFSVLHVQSTSSKYSFLLFCRHVKRLVPGVTISLKTRMPLPSWPRIALPFFACVRPIRVAPTILSDACTIMANT